MRSIAENARSGFLAAGATGLYGYSEWDASAYVEMSRKGESVAYSVGLMEGRSVGGRNGVPWRCFFPSGEPERVIFPKWAFVFNASRGITRPSIWQLNPTVTYLDPYSYIEGNPLPRPEIHHRGEAKVTFMEYASLVGSYTRKQDMIGWHVYESPGAARVNARAAAQY